MNNKRLIISSTVGTVVGGAVLFKEVFQGCRYTGTNDLFGRTVVITGANTGIGKATATEFAKRGARVIMACRDMDSCRKARRDVISAARPSLSKLSDSEGKPRRTNVKCEQLDLASFASIRYFAERMQNEPSINYLINNAATMRDAERKLTADGLERQMGINHFGHFLLTNLLLPKLTASHPSRIVLVSCIAHRAGEINFEDLNADTSYSATDVYAASKLANVLFAKQLARHLKDTTYVFAVDPGMTYTEIMRNLPVMHSFSKYIFKPVMWIVLQRPRTAAQPIVYAALSPDVENCSGDYVVNCAKRDPSSMAEDEQLAQRLWLVSEKWTRLKEPPQSTAPMAL